MRSLPILFVLTLISPMSAASAGRLGGEPIPTTHSGIAYGEEPAHRLDLWLATSNEPTPLLIYIHGGGFRGGARNGGVPFALFRRCLDAGISCASLDYRLSDVAVYPAQMHDCARALQFLRANAATWNLAAEHFAVTGGSAGAGISLWLAFHDDLAQLESDDPVAKQSTRVRCALPYNAQCSYDPRWIKDVVPGMAYNHPALKQLHGLPITFDWDNDDITATIDAALKDCSPITHLNPGDPPVWMLHYAKMEKIGDIHHPNFGRRMIPLMAEAGVTFVHRLDSDFPSGDEIAAEMLAFLQQNLLR